MKEEELTLFMRNHSNKEAAKHFGVSTSTVERKLRKLGLCYYDLKYGDLPKNINDTQREIVTGTLLGGATISRKNNFYSTTQRSDKKDYIDHIANVLQPFTISCKEVNRSDGCFSCQMRTITSPIFKNLRNIWYKDRKKIVPNDIVLTPRILSYWYCDDGYLLAKRKRIELATNGFSCNEVDMLISFLNRDFNIKAGLHYDANRFPIIRVNQRSYYNFIDIVKPYVVWESLFYKIDVSLTAKTREGWGANKLTEKQVFEIREMYNTNLYSQRQIAKLFAVSVRTINLIINNKIHKIKSDFGFGGGADYKLRL